MRTKIAIYSIALAGMIITGSGCKKYLDVNQNPNVAQDVPIEMLLPSAQIFTASAMGVDMQVNGSLWAQYWTQSPSSSQYKVYEQYQPSANDYDRVWTLFYSSALTDLNRMEQKAVAENKKDYMAIAKIMKAYIYHVTTDAWGDIPFSEALKGLQQDGGIASPKYDKQEAVYNGIISMLDSARTLIEGLTTENVHGDLVYGGDMLSWYKFANTLQLKVYMRLSEVNPAKAQAGIVNLYNATGGTFIESGETAQIFFTSSAGNQNPLFSEIQGLGFVQNLVGSATSIDSMSSNNDLRLEALYAGTLVGIPQGAYSLPASTPVARPSALTGAYADDDESALAPVVFISDYESMFLQAEAVARGWATGSDEDLFNAGIEASFAAVGLTSTDASDYMANAYWGTYPTGGTFQEKLRHIITQKWFSMNGTQGFEAWTEWRRTGYPDFFTISVNSIIGAEFPARFLYPNVEQTRNANFPGQVTVKNKVWWDIN